MSSLPPPPPGGPTPPPAYGAPVPQPAGAPPPNYLVWSILTTLFCCLPLGIVSIVFAAQVNSKWAAGDVNGALESSRKAKLFAILSASIGLVVAVIWVFVAVVAGISSDSGSSTGY